MENSKDLLIKDVDKELKGLNLFAAVDKSTKELFRFIVRKSEGGYYVANAHKERATEEVKIAISTYWRKLKKMEEIGMIVKESRGFYKVNPKLYTIIQKLDKDLRGLR